MRRFLISVASVLALTSGAAWAQDTSKSASPQGQEVQQGQTQATDQGQAAQGQEQKADQPQAGEQKAQDTQAQSDQPAGGAAVSGEAILVMQDANEHLAKAYLDAPVMTGTGDGAEEIGSVQDLILDDNQQLIGMVVGVGGFLGIGEKKVALAWDALELQEAEDGSVVFISALTREELEQAPTFKTKEAQRAEELRVQEQQQMQQRQQQMQPPPAAPSTGTGQSQ